MKEDIEMSRKHLKQVAQAVFDHAYELISSGSPAFDSEVTLLTLDLIYSKPNLVADCLYDPFFIYDLYTEIKQGNDSFRELGLNND